MRTDSGRWGGTSPLVALVGSGAVIGVATWIALSHTGHPVRPAVVVGLCVVGGVVAAVLRVVTIQVTRPPAVAADLRRVVTDRERGGVQRFARILESGLDSTDRFDLRVRPQLVRLADHALRRRHGVDLRSRPDLAHDLLGDSLWQMIRTTPKRPPTRQELAAWVARIEAL